MVSGQYFRAMLLGAVLALLLVIGLVPSQRLTAQAPTVTTFSNIAATTSNFTLRSAQYGMTWHATWGGGSATLQILAADGTTWLTAVTAVTVDGTNTAYLPAGTYRVLVATATGLYVSIIPILPQP